MSRYAGVERRQRWVRAYTFIPPNSFVGWHDKNNFTVVTSSSMDVACGYSELAIKAGECGWVTFEGNIEVIVNNPRMSITVNGV